MQTHSAPRLRPLALAVALSCAAFAIHPTQAADTFTGLGTLGGTYSVAYGISADGGVTVGL